MKLKVISTTSEKNTTVTASPICFADKVNKDLIAQAVRVYLANRRQGTSKTQTRSEVSRSSRKIYRQKGTGGARHGDKTANIFVGGATTHGPRGNQNWTLKLTKRDRIQALRSALAAQVDNILINEGINQLTGKTKSAAQLLKKLAPEAKKVLVVLPEIKDEIARSLRNIEGVYYTTAQMLNALDVVYVDAIVISKNTIKALEERMAKYVKADKPAAKAAPKAAVKKTPVKKTVKKTTRKAAPAKKKPAAKKATKKK